MTECGGGDHGSSQSAHVPLRARLRALFRVRRSFEAPSFATRERTMSPIDTIVESRTAREEGGPSRHAPCVRIVARSSAGSLDNAKAPIVEDSLLTRELIKMSTTIVATSSASASNVSHDGKPATMAGGATRWLDGQSNGEPRRESECAKYAGGKPS